MTRKLPHPDDPKRWQVVLSDGGQTIVRGDTVLCVLKLPAVVVAQVVRVELMAPEQ